jgi:hypothetical protein
MTASSQGSKLETDDRLLRYALTFFALLSLICGCSAAPIVTEAVYPADWPTLKVTSKCTDLSERYSYSGKGAATNPDNEFSSRRLISFYQVLNLPILGRLRLEAVHLTFRAADNSLAFRFMKDSETVYEYQLPNDKTQVSCERGVILLRTTPKSFGAEGVNISEASHETTLQSAENDDLVIQDYKRYTSSSLAVLREYRIERAWLRFKKM